MGLESHGRRLFGPTILVSNLAPNILELAKARKDFELTLTTNEHLQNITREYETSTITHSVFVSDGYGTFGVLVVYRG